jgi:predicted RNA-binding protein with PIN domain
MHPHLILLDGYNVIRRTPGLAIAELQSLETARQGLIQQVIVKYRGTPHRVMLIFDGQGAEQSIRPLRCGVGSSVLFTRAGEQADAVLVRLVEAAREEWGERILVITDDLQVRHDSAARGARQAHVDALSRHLYAAPRTLRKRAQHHRYLSSREQRDGDEPARGRSRKGNAHKAPRHHPRDTGASHLS